MPTVFAFGLRRVPSSRRTLTGTASDVPVRLPPSDCSFATRPAIEGRVGDDLADPDGDRLCGGAVGGRIVGVAGGHVVVARAAAGGDHKRGREHSGGDPGGLEELHGIPFRGSRRRIGGRRASVLVGGPGRPAHGGSDRWYR